VARLQALRDRFEGRIDVLALPENRGKGEAVRSGLVAALEAGADAVGYADADFSTPPSEILYLVDILREEGAIAVIGSRIARLGARIDRSAFRHYLGRAFAAVASISLARPVYDTQCGAKVFRASAALRDALSEPFHSRWAFDVELLGRLFRFEDADRAIEGRPVIEVPLRQWHDVGGSKLGLSSMAKAGMDLVSIGVGLRRRR
jgi:glycosyltransferase involved in cell wall biosynthesis